MKISRRLLILSAYSTSVLAATFQHPFSLDSDSRHPSILSNHPSFPPRIDYTQIDQDDRPVDPPENMTLWGLHVSGSSEHSYDLTFFADGYTPEEEMKFVDDATRLTKDIISKGGPLYDVSHLLNVWGVFVPSKTSGIGTHDKPLPGAAFGLYRSGAELRGVYVRHHRRARAACKYWREIPEAGCDQPIILGNDALYGGLGGEFTVITASKLNGPVVLRHELGHSLIDVGEEYEGGEVYSGVNADKPTHLRHLKWKKYLSDPKHVRIEDAKVPLQAYPWHDLSDGAYETNFTSYNLSPDGQQLYPTAMLRFSLSSIPYPDHIELLLNGHLIDLSSAFLPAWNGSLDRRWLELDLKEGLPAGESHVVVRLTEKGKKGKEGQGGKMITSIEIMEYGGQGRFNATAGHVGAYPTYSIGGRMSLRPTNEGCLMRNVLTPTFCMVCQHGLKDALHRKIRTKTQTTRDIDLSLGRVRNVKPPV